MGFRFSLRHKAYSKLVLYFVCFVILAVLIASLFQGYQKRNRLGQATPPSSAVDTKQQRSPASVFYDEENNQIVDLGIDEINNESGTRTGGPLFKAVKKSFSDDWGAGKIDAQEHTGINARRARRVVFQPAILHLAKRKDTILRLNLFDDLVLNGQFLPSSELHLNKGTYTGQIAGDPTGLFRLYVEGNAVSGTIEANGHAFQIVDAGYGQQYIIEVDNRANH
jgi:hypothetical protein